MGKLSLVIVKGIEYEGITKSGSFYSLRNILQDLSLSTTEEGVRGNVNKCSY